MKIGRFDIILNQAVYFPGQTIFGQVHLDLFEPTTIKGLKVRCNGKAKVSWQEGGRDNRTTYADAITYIDTELQLCGGRDGNVQVQAGRTVFPFKLALPEDIPMSFQGRAGRVYYELKAHIERPFGHADEERKLELTIGASDVGMPSVIGTEATRPSTGSKTVCCCCCESNPIEGTIRVNKKVFQPGESVTINAEIDNRSGKTVNKIRVDLKRITEFRTRFGSSMRSSDVISSVQGNGVHPKHSDFQSLSLPIPLATYPSLNPICPLIEVQYMAELVASIRGTVLDLKVAAPITIKPGVAINHSTVGAQQCTVMPNRSDNMPRQSMIPPPRTASIPSSSGIIIDPNAIRLQRVGAKRSTQNRAYMLYPIRYPKPTASRNRAKVHRPNIMI